jgi:hypothetical protein
MRKLEGIVSEGRIPAVISDLEEIAAEAPVVSVAAIHVLKNELAPVANQDQKRRLVFEQKFVLPGGIWHRIAKAYRQPSENDPRDLWSGVKSDFLAWLQGRDSVRFRDRCDQCFWDRVVPVVSAGFGKLADPVMNTVNEAIINYAEYSFGPRALRRRISAHLFRTEADLAYAIIRPSGTALRRFDPLALKTREPGRLYACKRGWGHTLLMERALFISFDHEPRKRGMMIIVGPDES